MQSVELNDHGIGAAIVLVGGQSRRMGKDKATMRLGNLSFMGHLLESFSSVPTWVVCGRANQLAAYRDSLTGNESVQWLEDSHLGRGPVEGIATGLRGVRAAFSSDLDPWCLVVPVDMPLVNLDAAAGMIAGHESAELIYFYDRPDLAGFPLVIRSKLAETIRVWVDAGGVRIQDLCRELGGFGVDAASLIAAGIDIARMTSANSEPEFNELLRVFERLHDSK